MHRPPLLVCALVSIVAVLASPLATAQAALCVKADQSVRATDGNKPCPAGERRLLLEERKEDGPKDDRAVNAEFARLRGQIDALTRRIAQLESPPPDPAELKSNGPSKGGGDPLRTDPRSVKVIPRNHFVAPFEVVDSKGVPLIKIFESPTRALALYNDAGKPVVYLASPQNLGGLVKVMDARTIDTRVSIGALDDKNLGLFVYYNDAMQVRVAGAPKTGHIGLLGSDGKTRAYMQVGNDNRGIVAVSRADERAISFLTESDKNPGTGNVTIKDPEGNGVFSAGWTPATGGNACVIRNGALWCTGVNIPLAIGGGGS